MSFKESKKKNMIKSTNKKSDSVFSNSILALIVLGVIGVTIRLFYFPYEVPFTYDSLDYFSYATSMSQIGHFPNNWALVNNGWPSFVSFFFTLFNNGSFIEYTHLQRVLNILISVLTIIPVYFLARKFFRKSLSIIVVSLFVFEPRIIFNSLLGITESIYILLLVTTLCLFFSDKKKFVYISFGIAALCSIIRYEGLLFIIPISIMFFIRFRRDNKLILKYLLALGIFLLVLSPIAILRIDAWGEDGLLSSYFAGVGYVTVNLTTGNQTDELWIKENQDNRMSFIINGITNLIKSFGYLLIPFFIIVFPVSLFYLIKNKSWKKIDYKTYTLILFTIVIMIPIFYGYGRNIEEVRFLLPLLPMLCLLSIPIFDKIQTSIRKPKIATTMFLICIIFASFMVMEYQKIDYDHEREAFEVAKYLVKNANGVNYISPESAYFKPAEVEMKWPLIPRPSVDIGHGHISLDVKKFLAEDFGSIEEFLVESKNSGLTHLILDGKENRAKFLNSIYQNDDDYPFLEKIYDSHEQHGLKYHVKIYLIDYESFEEIHKKDV
jgi:hypothetical protein